MCPSVKLTGAIWHLLSGNLFPFHCCDKKNIVRILSLSKYNAHTDVL